MNDIRILAVADSYAKRYYDHYRPGSLEEFDLILACGDLPREYLEFLVTMARCPVLYVRGNHDDAFAQQPPEGCICIEDRIYNFRGVRILGLGGSYRYGQGENMYTETQMAWRIRRLALRLWRSGGFDILLTHAPARGLNDLEYHTHRGFACFRTLMERYRPRYFIHGHVHQSYTHRFRRQSQYGDTQIINASEYFAFEY